MQEKQDHTEEILAAVDRLKAPDLDVERSLARWKEVHLEPKGVSRRMWIRASAAAVVGLLIGLFFIMKPNYQHIETQLAERTEHSLPDGSTVTLNADSRITFDGKRFQKSRNLQLHGEAFFEVQKGKAFVVETSLGSIEVLGTSFNVRARGDRLDVACATGKVRVAGKHLLTAGESVTISAGLARSETIGATEVASWKDGVSKFRDVPLAVVIAEMERQFDVTIDASSIEVKELYTGGFSHADIESALRAVFPAMGLKHTRSDDGTIVLSH